PSQKNYVFDSVLSIGHYFTYIKFSGIKAFEIKIEESLLFNEEIMKGEVLTTFGSNNVYELRENVYFILV
ncbi:MAG: hypothetical protein PHE12_00650, partial [Clostridia bacterium]|nr:hypothetical protein [Clostridia bacterium]